MADSFALIKPENLLFSAQVIQQRITELAGEISSDYQGREILVVGALKQSIFLVSDLIRQITVPVVLDFIDVERELDAGLEPVFTISKDLEENLNQKSVLVVQTLVDTGTSMEYLLDNFRLRNPKSLRSLALLRKESPASALELDYLGFKVASSFLVGYGLDYREDFRQLPAIYKLDKENL